ncbi:MAG: efflux RND transporter periplasmic adaptor subunit [Pseudomonadota bacterium]
MKPSNSQELLISSADRTITSNGNHNGTHDGDHEAARKIKKTSILHMLSRRLAQILLPALVIAAAIGAYNYLHLTKPPARKKPAQEIVLPVETIKIAFTDHQPDLTLYGTTVAGRQVELRALVAGKVKKAGPQLLAGGEVEEGETLLEIEPFDYEVGVAESKAQLAEAKAKLAETKASLEVERGNLASAREQLRLAQTDLKRAEPLATRGTVSERTVDDRRLVLLQRQQTVTQYENNIEVWLARKEQQEAIIARLNTVLRRSEKRLVETVLKAPFNAYVSDVGAQVGRMLSVNDHVATLIDRDWIEARFSLTDGQFGRLAESGKDLFGRNIDILWAVEPRILKYKARIERIDAMVKAENGGIQVFARINTPHYPASIRSGIFVEIKLPDVTYKNVAKVPSEAVYNEQDKKYVYAISDGRLQKREVTVVGTSSAFFLIKGEIKAGERIMTTRISRPGDGVRVKEVASNDI